MKQRGEDELDGGSEGSIVYPQREEVEPRILRVLYHALYRCCGSREKQSYLVGEAETHQEQGRLGNGTRCTINEENFTVGTMTYRKSALLVKRMGWKRRRPDLADIDWPLLNAALNSLLAQVQPALLLLLLTTLVRLR